MKANQKFLRGDDDAVSPVIAVILMVAITVVLAATVYVWVSGFNTGGSSARTLSLASAKVITPDGSDYYKDYVVASSSPGLKWNEVDITLDGTKLAYDGDTPYNTSDSFRVTIGGTPKTGTTKPSDVIQAGDKLTIYDMGASPSGKTLRLIDATSNSIMSTMVIS